MKKQQTAGTLKPPTKAQRKIILAAQTIQVEEALEAGHIGYLTKLLALVSLPYKNPRTSQYQRQNGNRIITFTNTSGGDLPYGRYPRLIIIWLITQVVQNRTQIVDLGSSLNQFMDHFELGKDGRTMNRFKTQAENLFDTNINVKEILDDDYNVGYMKADMKITAKSISLWSKKNPDQLDLFTLKLKLTDEFYQDILKTAFPIDMRAVKALTRNISLDLYLFLISRIFRLNKAKKKTAYISLQDLHGQIGANYSAEKNGMDAFRKDIKSALLEINLLWPELNYKLARGRLVLKTSSLQLKPRKQVDY